ncbi:hypothetical protein BH23CHL1_BH23CHL1_24580 [soil metagenome]
MDTAIAPRLLAAISEAVYASDLDGNVIYWNPAAEQFYGWTAGEALGRNVLDMIEDASIRGSVSAVLEAMRNRISWVRETTIQRKDGTRFPAQISLSQLRGEAGDVAGIVAVSHDISQRKQAEDERETFLAGEQTARIEAANAQRRAEQLLEVTAAFSRARTPAEVAQATVDHGITTLEADAGVILLMNEQGNALDLVHATGYPPSTIDRLRETSIPIDAGFPVSDAALTQKTIWISNREELLERYPAVAAFEHTYSAGVVSLPLTANGRTLGVLGLSYAEVHEFAPPERIFAETLAQFCAQALERAWLFAREQEARLDADAAQRRAVSLLRMTAALSRASTPKEVAQVAIEQGLATLNADAGIIALRNAAGTHLHVAHTSGYPADIVERWHTDPLPVDRPVPLAQATSLGEPIWIRSRKEMLDHYPEMAERPPIFSEAIAALPLIASNRVLGTFGLSYASPLNITESDRTYALTLTRLCAQALERAYLFADERDARIEAEEAQQRLTLLSQASDMMTTSLDKNETLTSIARLVVPRMADWCAIDVVGDDGLPERITVMHTDPEKVRWANELQKQTPFHPDAPTGLAKVLRTGETEFYPFITDDVLVAAARDEEQLKLFRMVGFSSVLIVPLIARGRTLGAITLVHAESGRHYTAEDLVLTENLAYRAALAVDNARLYEQAQDHAGRMDALAGVSHALAEARLDLSAVLETLGREIARLVGDTVILRLPSPDGQWLFPVAVHHPDPEAETAMRTMFDEHPLRWDEGLTGRVATTGEALLIPETSPEKLNADIKPAYRLWTERFGIHGVLIVPMRRGKRVAGTIALFRAIPGRPYTEADRQFVQEVADRAAMAVENAQLFHEAKEAVRLREEFLSIASHEIRTPMTTITGFAHLLSRQLARDTIDEERVDMLTGRLLHEAQRLNLIVTDLLDVSRIQQGQLDLRPEPCDLANLARQIVDRMSEAQERSTRREILLDAPSPVFGVWDSARLDQVLTNLISNAIKYSNDGPIQVTVSKDEGDESAALTVSDQGVGIPKEQQARLFEPFVRGDTAHHSSSGAGLGLYITHQIVEGHQGAVTLESNPGEGTVFIVRLPLRGTPEPVQTGS